MSVSTTQNRATNTMGRGGGLEACPTVIVGVDGTETANEAARCAARLAAAADASLTLVIAHPEGRCVHVQGPGGDSWDLTEAGSARGIAQRVAHSVRNMVEEVHIVAGAGKPAEVLVEQAQRLDADLIVVGNRRVQGASRVLGAIATAVLRQAPCDVYIAKTA